MVDGKYYTIDAHCHIYPEKIALKAVAGTDGFYGTVSCFDGTVEKLIESGTRAGVDKFLVQSVATTPKQVESINVFIANQVSEKNGKLVGLGTLHPDSEDLSYDVKKIVSLGLKGVKLHPDIQRFKLDDYRCLKIFELCEEYNLPVLIHTGDSRYDFSNPNRLIPVLEIYTNLTVIGAHFGGYSIWETASEQLKDIKNLYVDCSSSFHWLNDEQIKKIIRRYGADRVLYGSDYPMWDSGVEIKRLLSLGLKEEEYRMIFSENAKKVFSL